MGGTGSCAHADEHRIESPSRSLAPESVPHSLGDNKHATTRSRLKFPWQPPGIPRRRTTLAAHLTYHVGSATLTTKRSQMRGRLALIGIGSITWPAVGGDYPRAICCCCLHLATLTHTHRDTHAHMENVCLPFAHFKRRKIVICDLMYLYKSTWQAASACCLPACCLLACCCNCTN